jgi:hypothetical protein
MRKPVLTLLIIFGILGAVRLVAQSTPPPSQGLKVFVSPFEGSNAAEASMLGSKLISHLVKRGVSVTESVDDADAVLTGSGLVQTSTTDYGHVRYHLQAGMRLVNKDGSVLWANDVSNSRFSESASSSFADNVAKSVAQALSPRAQK